ncbi:MAG: hypothetical protein JJT77_07415 [Crocinitomicaceae bacterium]|nr:hypothetical protein [Crocinitomicaceae bacterium]MCC5935634.1 hypothetical protein [Balneolales bacterium]
MLLKLNCIFLFCATMVAFFSWSNLSIEGSYQGKNLYVQNAEDTEGFGFCVTKVTVNGDVLPTSINKSAFEINFALFNLQIGDPIFVVLEHNDGCAPKVLNPEVLLPKSTFVLQSLKVDNQGVIKWETTGEDGKLPFIIEQFRWNKWVAVGEVQGTGKPELSKYQFQIIPHSGENIVRVVQIDFTGKKNASSSANFVSDLPVIEMTPIKVKTEIRFFAKNEPVETRFEIYDAYGNIVKKGFASVVNCTNLRKGAYYINFDNRTEKFIKG